MGNHLRSVGTIFLSLLAGFSVQVLAQSASSPLKSIPEEQVRAYLTGQGLGFAKVAELHHYPGPAHVLELKTSLGLSETQIKQSEALFKQMQTEAMQLGDAYIASERALEQAFAKQNLTQPQLQELVQRSQHLQASLRLCHLRAHLQQQSLLTPAQIKLYDQLRGHATADHKHHHSSPPAYRTCHLFE